MDLNATVAECLKAWTEFANGKPERAKALFSHRDDVTLANPFGPAVSGWDKVAEALDYASSKIREGKVDIETVAKYVTDELATYLNVEHWQGKVGGRSEAAPFVLRVSTTYRREDGIWKIVHRHADPINTFSPDGPMRAV
jgi:ketosteroid isomerase-like protein